MQLHVMTVNYIYHWRLNHLSLSLQLMIKGQLLLYFIIMSHYVGYEKNKQQQLEDFLFRRPANCRHPEIFYRCMMRTIITIMVRFLLICRCGDNLYCFTQDLLLHKHETHCRIKHRCKFTTMYTSDMNNFASAL
jgi:hypothetical protein